MAFGGGRDSNPQARAPSRPQSGIASFYGSGAAGKKTASGARFAPNRMTAASRTLPLGTRAKVVNTRNGKSANVVVTDRGPFAKNRILDVSPKAARRLGMKSSGVSNVKVQPLPAHAHAP
jgi:rare lipoprotein A